MIKRTNMDELHAKRMKERTGYAEAYEASEQRALVPHLTQAALAGSHGALPPVAANASWVVWASVQLSRPIALIRELAVVLVDEVHELLQLGLGIGMAAVHRGALPRPCQVRRIRPHRVALGHLGHLIGILDRAAPHPRRYDARQEVAALRELVGRIVGHAGHRIGQHAAGGAGSGRGARGEGQLADGIGHSSREACSPGPATAPRPRASAGEAPAASASLLSAS